MTTRIEHIANLVNIINNQGIYISVDEERLIDDAEARLEQEGWNDNSGEWEKDE
jgi:hypothetical protein